MLDIKIKKKQGKKEYDYKLKTEAKIIAIMGLSGSGKTTFLRLLSGLIKPDSGYIKVDDKVFFDEKKINLKTRERKVGYVFQSENLFPHLSIERNLKLGLDKEDYPKVDEWIKRVDLKDKLESKPENISGGEKQRIAVIRALIHNPNLLLLDEAFNSLDEENKEILYREIKILLKSFSGYTILVTHDKNEALKLSDEIYYLHDEKLEKVYSNLIEGNITYLDENHLANTFTINFNDKVLKGSTVRSAFKLEEAIKLEIKAHDVNILRDSGKREDGFNYLTGTVKNVINNDLYEIDLSGNNFYGKGDKLQIGDEITARIGFKDINII